MYVFLQVKRAGLPGKWGSHYVAIVAQTPDGVLGDVRRCSTRRPLWRTEPIWDSATRQSRKALDCAEAEVVRRAAADDVLAVSSTGELLLGDLRIPSLKWLGDLGRQ